MIFVDPTVTSYPTRAISSSPSSAPSIRLPCEADPITRLYGEESDTETFVVFGYEVETAEGTTTEEIINEVLPAVELQLLNNLLPLLFPDECPVVPQPTRRRKLQGIEPPPGQEFVGASTLPPDTLLENRECAEPTPGRCDVVRGNMTLYSADIEDGTANNVFQSLTGLPRGANGVITTVINNGALDNAHAKLLHVSSASVDDTSQQADDVSTTSPSRSPSTTAPSLSPTRQPFSPLSLGEDQSSPSDETGDKDKKFVKLFVFVGILLILLCLGFWLIRRILQGLSKDPNRKGNEGENLHQRRTHSARHGPHDRVLLASNSTGESQRFDLSRKWSAVSSFSGWFGGAHESKSPGTMQSDMSLNKLNGAHDEKSWGTEESMSLPDSDEESSFHYVKKSKRGKGSESTKAGESQSSLGSHVRGSDKGGPSLPLKSESKSQEKVSEHQSSMAPSLSSVKREERPRSKEGPSQRMEDESPKKKSLKVQQSIPEKKSSKPKVTASASTNKRSSSDILQKPVGGTAAQNMHHSSKSACAKEFASKLNSQKSKMIASSSSLSSMNGKDTQQGDSLQLKASSLSSTHPAPITSQSSQNEVTPPRVKANPKTSSTGTSPRTPATVMSYESDLSFDGHTSPEDVRGIFRERTGPRNPTTPAHGRGNRAIHVAQDGSPSKDVKTPPRIIRETRATHNQLNTNQREPPVSEEDTKSMGFWAKAGSWMKGGQKTDKSIVNQASNQDLSKETKKLDYNSRNGNKQNEDVNAKASIGEFQKDEVSSRKHPARFHANTVPSKENTKGVGDASRQKNHLSLKTEKVSSSPSAISKPPRTRSQGNAGPRKNEEEKAYLLQADVVPSQDPEAVVLAPMKAQNPSEKHNFFQKKPYDKLESESESSNSEVSANNISKPSSSSVPPAAALSKMFEQARNLNTAAQKKDMTAKDTQRRIPYSKLADSHENKHPVDQSKSRLNLPLQHRDEVAKKNGYGRLEDTSVNSSCGHKSQSDIDANGKQGRGEPHSSSEAPSPSRRIKTEHDTQCAQFSPARQFSENSFDQVMSIGQPSMTKGSQRQSSSGAKPPQNPNKSKSAKVAKVPTWWTTAGGDPRPPSIPEDCEESDSLAFSSSTEPTSNITTTNARVTHEVSTLENKEIQQQKNHGTDEEASKLLQWWANASKPGYTSVIVDCDKKGKS